MRWLDAYVYPSIGDMQLDEVQPGDVLAIIKARADTAVADDNYLGRCWMPTRI